MQVQPLFSRKRWQPSRGCARAAITSTPPSLSWYSLSRPRWISRPLMSAAPTITKNFWGPFVSHPQAVQSPSSHDR
eukprot:1547827-Amphidinium_carterae.1